MKSAKAEGVTAQNVAFFPLKRENRTKDELEFLPAAIEVVETPPSPIGRAIAATIMIAFCVALAWAILGRVDIIASASGKVVPSGEVKLIQPFETGVVRTIRVRDGQRVKAGDVLIELDPTMTDADVEHIRSDLTSAQLDVARLRAELSGSNDLQAAYHPPRDASADAVAMQRQFLATQTEEYRAKLGSLDGQLAQKAAERDTIAGTIDKIEATEPLIQQRVDILKGLSDKHLGSILTYLEAQQLLTENEKDLAVQQSKLIEAKAAIVTITENRAEEAAQFNRKLFEELADADRKVGGLGGDLVKAEQRTKLQLLTAPVDGVVQQLSVHTVGGVVTPAQQLAIVVPSDSTLEVEASISNQDSGFVHVGQEAQIKVDAFPFTRYGLLHGRIVDISRDAIVHDVAANDRGSPNDQRRTTSEPKGQELIYSARVSLDQTQIPVDDAVAKLLPGMAVTVEVKTGSRSLISYLLSPLLRYRQESLRER